MNKLIRTSTVAISLDFLLKGQLAYLQKKYEVIAVSGNDDHLKQVESREGVRTVDISMQRSISPMRDLISLWQLYLLCPIAHRQCKSRLCRNCPECRNSIPKKEWP